MAYTTSPQTIAWFWDQLQRQQLDLDPTYQRRSVWNQQFRDEFIDTITLGYPCPEIFLYADISAEGATTHHVVDGKQRLETIFKYLRNEFALPDNATLVEYQGKYFEQLTPDQKRSFWSYPLNVVFFPTAEEAIINDVFNRINKNVARLTRQELRHARFNGVFITAVEELSDWFNSVSPDFPRIAPSSRGQMRDVELVATLCLLLEEGVRSHSADDLDREYSAREADWPLKHAVEGRFREIATKIQEIINSPEGEPLKQTRLRNIVDYYSFFGAVDRALEGGYLGSPEAAANKLRQFIDIVESEELRVDDVRAQAYYDAARSATNDVGPRTTRIEIIDSVLREGA